VDYARKVLNFSEISAKILFEQELNGRRLLRVENKKELTDAGLSLGAASDLWTEIEKMKKSLAEPEVTSVFGQMRSPSRMPFSPHYRYTQPDENEHDYSEQPLQKNFSTPRRLTYDESFFDSRKLSNAQNQADFRSSDRQQLTPMHLLNTQGNFGASTSRKRKRDSEGERERFDEGYLVKKPRLEIKVNRRTSSLIGRDKEMARIFSCVDSNIETFYTRPSTIVISGTCGIGKTCLALHIAQSKLFDLCLATMITPKCAILAHEIFNDKSATTVETALENWILPHILAGEHEKKMKVVIYIDEIQNLAVKELDALRAGIMRFILRQKDDIAIQLIVSGVAAAFLPVKVTPNVNGADIDVSYGGFRVFNLQPLNMEDSAKLLTEFLKLDGRYSNFSAIVGQPAVQQALQWAGGNARLIEFIAAKATRDNNDFQTLHDHVIEEYKNAYPSRFSFNINTYACFINACLAQIPVKFDTSLVSKGATISSFSEKISKRLTPFLVRRSCICQQTDQKWHCGVQRIEGRGCRLLSSRCCWLLISTALRAALFQKIIPFKLQISRTQIKVRF
jgi:hypothetical protein